jgi:hypothetical protein
MSNEPVAPQGRLIKDSTKQTPTTAPKSVEKFSDKVAKILQPKDVLQKFTWQNIKTAIDQAESQK